MSATSISVSQETRKLLESLKMGGETYDDVIRGLIVAHPNQLTMAELSRRIRDGKRHPIEDLIVKSGDRTTEKAVPFRIESIDEADGEFLGLPPPVRETFIAAFRELAVAETPTLNGPGWYTEELRQNQRIAPGGLFSLHVGDLWRGAFYRDENNLIFIGFGYRIPEFYDKLARLRKAVGKSSE